MRSRKIILNAASLTAEQKGNNSFSWTVWDLFELKHIPAGEAAGNG